MVFVMTRGGPGSATDLVSIYIQRVGFRVFDLGTASAQAILLLVITILLSPSLHPRSLQGGELMRRSSVPSCMPLA